MKLEVSSFKALYIRVDANKSSSKFTHVLSPIGTMGHCHKHTLETHRKLLEDVKKVLGSLKKLLEKLIVNSG